jgi:hypothetical protein
MEQMKADGLDVVEVDFNDKALPESVQQTHPLVFKDGTSYCCVLGPDPQTGIFGCGPTIKEALEDFDLHFREVLAHPIEGDPVSEYIRHRHV